MPQSAVTGDQAWDGRKVEKSDGKKVLAQVGKGSRGGLGKVK